MRESVDIFDEVTEEVQQERLLKLWHTYKIYIFGIAIAIIIGTTAYSIWKHYHEKKLHNVSTIYTKALNLEKINKTAEASVLLQEVIKSGAPGFKALALLSLSDILLKQNKQEALQLLQDLSKDKKMTRPLKNLAIIRSILIELDQQDPAILRERLKPLLNPNDAKNAWYPLALELEAALEYRQGNLEKAEALYHTLSESPTAPSGVHNRALRMLMILTSKKTKTS